ncbi:MAG TPA: hypothetical protein VF170_07000 [Planctomycetaceae bacterium]
MTLFYLIGKTLDRPERLTGADWPAGCVPWDLLPVRDRGVGVPEGQGLMLRGLDEAVRLVRPLMTGFGAPWGVAGGWAIDLFLGRMTRPHRDMELAIFRPDQSLLRRHLPGWRFEKVVGGRREPWSSEEILSLPVHELHARSAAEPTCEVEFLLNERDADDWVFRRNPAVVLPLERAFLRSACGLPALAPEIVLLFKAKSPRPKDEADFRSACGVMSPASRRWLRAALGVCHPDHPWLGAIAAGLDE